MFDRSGELPSKAEYEYVSGGSGNSSGSGSEREDNDTTQTRSKTNEEPDAASKTKSLLQQTNRRQACLSLRPSLCPSVCRSLSRSVGRSLIVLSEQCSAAQSRAERSRDRARSCTLGEGTTNHSEQCNQNIITHIIAPVLSPNHRDANVSSLLKRRNIKGESREKQRLQRFC